MSRLPALHISRPLTGHLIFCKNSLKSLHDGYRRSASFTNTVSLGRKCRIFLRASRPGASLSRKACTFSYLERKSFDLSTIAVEFSTHRSNFPSAGSTGLVTRSKAGNVLGSGTSLKHAVTQFETSVIIGEP